MREQPPRVLDLVTAAELGITRSAISHGLAHQGWQRLLRGVVFTRPDGLTRDDWILAGLSVAGRDAALSGWDAVRIRGIGAATPPTARVLILARDGHARRGAGVLVRPTTRPYRTTLLPAEHPTLPFVPLVHPARAVADTALLYRSRAPVRALLTSAVQRRLCQADELVAEYDAGPRGGSYWLRRALPDVRANAHSIAEAEAADALGAGRVPSFELNVDIVDRRGRLLAVADVLWRALRAIGEVDSRAHHLDQDPWEATLIRHNRLTRHALAIEHWAPSQIRRDTAGWAAGVAAWLRGRAAELGVPYVPGDGPVVHDGPPPPFVVP